MKISVIIPLYNKRETILRAINSVLVQSILPHELIVINDGSVDGSEKVIKELKNPFIKLIEQKNSGVSRARNKGISEATGDWVAFLDADDEWLPGFIEKVLSLSKNYPGSTLIATAYFLENCDGRREKIILKKLPFKQEDGLLENYFKVASFSSPPICSSSVVVKKSSLENIGGFPIGIKSGEDLLTWARLAISNKIAYSVIPLSVFNINDNNKVSRMPEIPDLVGLELRSIDKKNKLPYLKNYIALWHKMRASSYLALGYKKLAISEINKSIKYSIFSRAWFFIPFILVNNKTFLSASRRYRRLLTR